MLGTLGEIPRDARYILSKFGVGVDNVRKVLRELHFNAIRWMEKCIDLETELNQWDTYYQFVKKRKRPKEVEL